MCGRYGRRSDKQKTAEHFLAKPEPAEFPMPNADYNIAPTTYQPIIRQSRETIADPASCPNAAVRNASLSRTLYR
jgi:putative SOS response-associated peptidase YedK